MTTLTIPASQLYWGVIDAPTRIRGSTQIETARFSFETLIPVPIDEVEVRWLQVHGSPSEPSLGKSGQPRWIGCAIEHTTLQKLLVEAEASGQQVEHAVPAAWPEFLQASVVSASEHDLLHTLEFRSGAFASPRSIRIARRRLTAIAALLCLAAGSWSAAWIGESRSLRAEAQQLRADAAQRIDEALGTPQGAAVSLDPELRLTAELRSLRQSRNQSAMPLRSEDRLTTYLDLLTNWPTEIPTRTDSIQLDQESLSIRGLVKTPEDYETLNRTIGAWLTSSQWTNPAGSSSRAGEAHAFTLAARRSARAEAHP